MKKKQENLVEFGRRNSNRRSQENENKQEQPKEAERGVASWQDPGRLSNYLLIVARRIERRVGRALFVLTRNENHIFIDIRRQRLYVSLAAAALRRRRRRRRIIVQFRFADNNIGRIVITFN